MVTIADMTLEEIKRLFTYYLACVRNEEGLIVRGFSAGDHQFFASFPLSAEWTVADQSPVRLDLTGFPPFRLKLQQLGQKAALLYGYPVYVRQGLAYPVFLYRLQHERVADSLDLELPVQWPEVNPEFMNLFFQTPEEKRSFLDRLGLLETPGDPPPDLMRRLVRVLAEEFPDSSEEQLTPDALSSEPPLTAANREGFYNRAFILLGEASPFTVGLIKELKRLTESLSDKDIDESALRCLFRKEQSAQTLMQSGPLVEVVPLNEEQRKVVASAFTASLTVVTGPPGTGKSQVVQSVLANAYWRGQKVLFASRNNKAVDVVEQRLNELTGHKVVVRSGRKFRPDLISFLRTVTSTHATETELEEFRHAQDAATTLESRRTALWQDAERAKQTRDRVEELHQQIQSTGLPGVVLDAMCALDHNPQIGKLSQSLKLAQWHSPADKGLLAKLYRVWRRKKDFTRIEETTRQIAQYQVAFGNSPAIPATKENIQSWAEYLASVAERLTICRICQDYRQACRQLEQTPTPSELAARLLDLERATCAAGLRLLCAYVRTLPDRMNPESKKTVGEYEANLQRLALPNLPNAEVAEMLREQERMFPVVAQVLPIWSVTNLAVNGAFPLQRGLFDLVIIDEASQCDIPSALPLLYRARRAVIVGDPHQLSHIATIKPQQDSKEFQQAGFVPGKTGHLRYDTNSLFALAKLSAGPGETFELREHFRSHADIIGFSNSRKQWYDGRLDICTDYRQLHAPDGQLGVRWFNVVSEVRKPHQRSGAIAEREAQAVAMMVHDLIVKDCFGGTVGVVAPFREQANRIRDLLSRQVPVGFWEQRQLMVEVVHGFQGNERDVMFFSPCVGIPMPDGARHFLEENGNLFNVAITRARASLQVVGNKEACRSCGIRFLEDFVTYVESRQPSVPIPPGPEVGENEPLFREAMIQAGLQPMPQYKEHQYRLDFAIKETRADGREIKLNIEVDGWQHLGSRQDVLRDRRLMLLGWHVKRFWNYQVRDHLDSCVAEVIQILEKFQSMPKSKH